MKYGIYLINVSRKSTQIQLPIWLSVLVNTLKMHDMKPHVIDLIPIDSDNLEETFKKLLPEEPSILGFNIMAAMITSTWLKNGQNWL